MPWRLIAAVASVLALLGVTWWHGHRTGAAGVRADWQAQQLADREAAEAKLESQRLRAQAAATNYEAQRAAIARRATLASPEVRNALNAPICARLGDAPPSIKLGDVPVPDPVLQRLRDAGADPTGH